MGMVICNQCGIEFKDKSPHLKSKKFCCREHFRLYKAKYGTWNKGKKWNEMYNKETLDKLQIRIKATGEEHHLYGIKRPDVVLSNLLKNPMYNEEKKKEILDMMDKNTPREVIIKLMNDMTGHRNFQYQRKAYKFYGESCTICGATKNEIQIDVHHVDGNRKNNQIENLRVWCASCHAIHHKNPDGLPQTI